MPISREISVAVGDRVVRVMAVVYEGRVADREDVDYVEAVLAKKVDIDRIGSSMSASEEYVMVETREE